jgi:hypothetical protein
MTSREGGHVHVVVHVPDDPPVLTRAASRILLEMLRDATEIEALDPPRERGCGDC